MKKHEQIYNKVLCLLRENSRYRDNDNFLIAKYWYDELQTSHNLRHISAFSFLEMFRDDKLTRADSISRLRRKIEELHPELRGESWNKRQTRKQDKAKDDIKNMGGYTP